MYAKVEDNKVIAFGALSQILPNVSIPQDADEKKVAKSNGLLEVVQPEFDDFQEKCEICEPYVKNGKVYVYEVKSLSDEEKIEIVNAHVEFELISTACVANNALAFFFCLMFLIKKKEKRAIIKKPLNK